MVKLQNYTFGDIADLMKISSTLFHKAANIEEHLKAAKEGKVETTPEFLQLAESKFKLYDRLGMVIEQFTENLLKQTFLPENSEEEPKKYSNNVIEGKFGNEK